MALMLRCVWLSCLLAGCVVPGGRAPAPALEPFVAASRFVPDGMKSFAFLQSFPSHWRYGGTPKYQVWAGCDFEGPHGVGTGASRTVMITDFGTGGIDATILANIQAAKLEEMPLGTHSCWHIRSEPRNGTTEAWFAIRDERFVVLATVPEVLVRALEQRGELSTVLVPFGDLAFLPADATDLIFTLPRPEELGRFGQAPPLQPMVFTLSREPRRAAMFSKDPPHSDFTGIMGNFWQTKDPPVQRIGEWLCHADPWRDSRPPADQWRDALAIAMLFGFRIFI
jgi:hypothetical protein